MYIVHVLYMYVIIICVLIVLYTYNVHVHSKDKEICKMYNILPDSNLHDCGEKHVHCTCTCIHVHNRMLYAVTVYTCM